MDTPQGGLEPIEAWSPDSDVEEALRHLPLEYLEVVVMVDIEELSYEETATVLGCSVATVRSHLSRGRRILQTALARRPWGGGAGCGGKYAVR